MAKKKKVKTVVKNIPLEDLEVDGTYKSYVGDVVKILKIDEKNKTVVLYNVSGSHKQWTSFNYINLVEKIR